MKRIFNLGLVLISVLSLTGCEDIPGVLNVVKDFNVIVKGKNKTISQGSHDTSLDFKRNKVIASIKTGDKTDKIEISVPQGAQIPNNGNFELKSAQTGQPFDILGAVQTKVTDSRRYSGMETCQKQEYQTICDPKGCHVVPVTRQGNRQIEFFYRDTDQAMQFDMTAVAELNNKYAHFDGRVRYTEKVVTYEGMCF